jgi:hypothetical protein
VNPLSLPQIFKTAKKTDRVDADMTALKNNLYALFRQWLVQVDKGFVIERLDRALEHPRLPPEARTPKVAPSWYIQYPKVAFDIPKNAYIDP